MLILKKLGSQLHIPSQDSLCPTETLTLSFRLDPEQSRLFIVWRADVEGRPVNVWINALELSDLNGQGVCDYDAILKALKTHRDYLERHANMQLIDGEDEVVLDLASQPVPLAKAPLPWESRSRKFDLLSRP